LEDSSNLNIKRGIKKDIEKKCRLKLAILKKNKSNKLDMIAAIIGAITTALIWGVTDPLMKKFGSDPKSIDNWLEIFHPKRDAQCHYIGIWLFKSKNVKISNLTYFQFLGPL